MREVDALQGHCSVVTQLVGIEEYTRLTAQLVHHIHDALVLQTVVLVEIPLATALARSRDLLVVSQLRQTLQQFAPEGDLLQIGVGHLVLCLHPCSRLGAGVVLEPTIGVGHFHTEILVDGTVFRSLGIL